MSDVEPDVDVEQIQQDAAAAQARTAELEASLAAQQRELTFLRAGVDLDTPVGKLFAKGYDGPLDDVEAVKSSAREVGAIPVPPPPDAQTVASPEEQTSRAAVAAVATDSAPPTAATDVHPGIKGLREFREARSKGQSIATARAKCFDSIFEAAAQGDPRVVAPANNQVFAE